MTPFNIETEDANIHWKFLKPAGKVVMDLGCGRWCARDGNWDSSIINISEFSSIWMAIKGAEKVIGIDAEAPEIEFFNKLNQLITSHPLATEKLRKLFTFEHQPITSPEILKMLLKKYDPQVIKCDIERAEEHFDSFNAEDLSNVEQFAVEYHAHDIRDNFLKKFSEWGFTVSAHGIMWVDGFGVLFAEKN